ncbi:TIGR03943 family protein [Microbacterium sp. 20-116]|uniref:TIGR03943 family putative permease subunit n=1 Tax=unclassified Microbacterium TaxID=2609290 RepID=UPI002791CAF4|nr:TIGR03943 family protein [Microbacterium sp. SORGH_AS_0421]MDQ1175361.1 putative repeat protein (TIGR03943 family) [Microbacterium sp. SORGH_AS_0421]
MSEFLSRWTGLILCGIGVLCTLALAARGDLTLYIHPRYVVFTVVLTLVGAALFALAVWFSLARRAPEHDDHGHDHAPRRGLLATAVSGTLVVVAALALLVAPPAVLSAERALTSTAATSGGGDVAAPSLVGSDPTRFSLRDWATILGAGSTASDLVGQQADVTGFVLLDAATDTARIGRYAVTCCTVDAQLFAVRIERSALPAGVETGAWVRVAGTFTDDDGATVLRPDTIEEVPEPDDPYLS